MAWWRAGGLSFVTALTHNIFKLATEATPALHAGD
jgi:hypothetical protein